MSANRGYNLIVINRGNVPGGLLAFLVIPVSVSGFFSFGWPMRF